MREQVNIELGKRMARDSILTKEEKEYVRKVIAAALYEPSVTRKLLTYTKVDASKETVVYYTETATGDAVIATGPVESGGLAHTTRNEKPLLWISKDFGLPQHISNTVLARQFTSATKRVVEQENVLVLNGWLPDGSTAKVNGLYQAANNSTSGSDFGTAGNAISSVETAIGLLQNDKVYGPYYLVINPTQGAELMGSIYTGGVDEAAKVNRMLGGSSTGYERIVITAHQTAGTGMVFDPSQDHMEVFLAEDVTEMSQQVKTDRWAMVYERLLPVIYHTDAVCKLTRI